MGVVIMLGSLAVVIALIYFLVLRFDPESRRAAPVDVEPRSAVLD